MKTGVQRRGTFLDSKILKAERQRIADEKPAILKLTKIQTRDKRPKRIHALWFPWMGSL
jgi:hypothetical protein